MATEWTTRWGRVVATKPSRPGIYRLREGGYLVRGRITTPNTSKRRTVIRSLPHASVEQAQKELDDLKAAARSEARGSKPHRQTFCAFAISRFEAKVEAGDIKSAKGRKKWESVLRVHLLPAFGERLCDELSAWHIAKWREHVAKMISEGYESSRKLRSGNVKTRQIVCSPSTANTWIGILKTICSEMTAILELPRDPAAALKNFDTSQHPTYTDESPNSASPKKAREFMTEMQQRHPQHYAMVLLGFATGKRPSTLRPIRASGPDADVSWEEGFIRFRRSHTLGDEVMDGTKTGTREKAHLPAFVVDVMRAHVAMVKNPPLDENGKPPLWWRKPMAESPLLFPGRHGGLRTSSCLDKPFRDVSKRIGVTFRLTPRAMRRTFQDLARDAEIDAVVTRSISGHATERMQEHYSTARAEEQRSAIGKIAELVADGPSTPFSTPSTNIGDT